MKQENIDYALRLDNIGDLMIEISECIEVGNLASLTEAIERYEYANNSLAEIDPPIVIVNEHKTLTRALTKWITATKQAAGMKDENAVKNALIGQKQTELDIRNIIEKIIEKFNK